MGSMGEGTRFSGWTCNFRKKTFPVKVLALLRLYSDRISGTYEVHLLVYVINIADPKYEYIRTT